MSIDALNVRSMTTQALQAKEPQPAVAPLIAESKTAPAVQAAKHAPTLDQVHAAAEQIERFLKSSGRDLDFHVDSETGKIVVSVRDAVSGDLIRQMPSEEALRLAHSLGGSANGLVDLVV